MTRSTCREVAVALAFDDVSEEPTADMCDRHLASCPKCIAFKRQLAFIDEAVRSSCLDFSREPPDDFEARLIRRLCS